MLSIKSFTGPPIVFIYVAIKGLCPAISCRIPNTNSAQTHTHTHKHTHILNLNDKFLTYVYVITVIAQ